MDIDTDMLPNIPVDSVASLSAENVLGTKFINIRRGQSHVGVKQGARSKRSTPRVSMSCWHRAITCLLRCRALSSESIRLSA